MQQVIWIIFMSSSLMMDCIAFAVDSAGGLSDSARKFINDLYANPNLLSKVFGHGIKIGLL